jgi:outer membrane lipoprotein-sorting protein
MLSSTRAIRAPRWQRLRAAALLALLAAMAGCAVRQSSNPAASAPDDSARALAARDRRLQSLQSAAIMEYSGPGGRLKVREQLIVRRPASLRVEAMSPLGVALVVAADQSQIAVFNPSQNVLMRGGANADTLDRFARIPMPPREAVQLLLALPPDSSVLGATPSAVSTEGTLKVLAYSLEDGSQCELGFAGGQLEMVRESGKGGQVSYEVHYDDYRDIGGVTFPFKIEANFFASATKIKLTYSNPSIDSQIADSVFVLAPGPGTRLIDLGNGPTPATEMRG